MHTAVAPQLLFVYIVGAQSAFPPQMSTLKSNLDKIKRYALEICNDYPEDWKSKETISTLRAFTKKVNAVTREMNKTLNDLYKEHHHRPRASKKNTAPTKKRRITQIEDTDDESAPPMETHNVAALAMVDEPPPADSVPPPPMESDKGVPGDFVTGEDWFTNGAHMYPMTPLFPGL